MTEFPSKDHEDCPVDDAGVFTWPLLIGCVSFCLGAEIEHRPSGRWVSGQAWPVMQIRSSYSGMIPPHTQETGLEQSVSQGPLAPACN